MSTRGLATGRGTRGSCGLRFSEFFLQNIVFQTSGCRVRAPGPVGEWVASAVSMAVATGMATLTVSVVPLPVPSQLGGVTLPMILHLVPPQRKNL